MRHSFKKPRYKICFQTRNKVWIYKNSRLRNFYKIRSKIVIKAGKRARRFLITKNMKWTVARRQMVPYFRKVRRYSCYFKKLFFTKQQLKNFYGGLKEYEIRNFFKKTWNKEQIFKTNIFIGSLEQRLNVILYRMRLLPTIFACNQLVQHKGVLVNNFPITHLNFRVRLGDVVSISKTYWFIFYRFLYQRLAIRYLGEGYAIYRKVLLIKKVQRYFSKTKRFFYYNLKIKRLYGKQKRYIKNIKKLIRYFYKNLKTKNHMKRNKKLFFWLRLYNWLFQKKVKLQLKKASKSLKHLKFWGKKYKYLKKINYIWRFLKNIHLNIKKFNTIFQHFLQNFILVTDTLIFSESENTQNLFLKKFLQDTFNLSSSSKLKIISQIRNVQTIKYRKKFFKKRRFFFIKPKSGYIRWIIRKLKFKKNRKNFFKQYCLQFHWYVPEYLEIDFKTLRAAFVYYPSSNEVFFPFLCSFKRIVSFYKERAL
jgi:ribosomal protein S4